jgi:hypothetical protein
MATRTSTFATLTVVEYSSTDCSTPSTKATITLPLSWPIPPTTITRKASMITLVPIVGPIGPTRVSATPATPASPEPMKKAVRSTREVEMPDTSARSRFCTTARIRRPSGVSRSVSDSATTAAIDSPRMNSRLLATVSGSSPPIKVMFPVRASGARVCTFGAPKMSRASCWSINETPQVTRSVSRGRRYSLRISSHSRRAPRAPETRKATGRATSSEIPALEMDFCRTYVV